MRNTKITLLALMAIAVLSCTSPTKDFNIHIQPAFYKYIVEVELSDINNPGVTFTDPVTIDIEGPDAEGIYNIDGTKNFDINFGVIQLLVSRDFEPEPGSPLNFRININSNTYKDVSIPIEIDSESYYLQFDLEMLDLTNLPSGLSNTSKSGGIGSNGQLSQPLIINTGSSDSLSKISITVPADVTFQDANGNLVSGSQLNTSVLSLSDTSSAGVAALPNGGGMSQPVTVNGETFYEVLEPTSTFEINMDVDGQLVKNFSGSGISMKMDIADDIYNEDALRNYLAGDSISIISYSEGDAGWKDDGTYLIFADGNGDLFINAKTTHLSYFKIIGKPLGRGDRRAFKVIAKLATGLTQTISGRIVINLGGTLSSGRKVSGKINVNGPFSPNKSITSRNIRLRRGLTAVTANISDRGSVSTANYNFVITEAVPGEIEIEISPKNTGVDVSFSLYCAGNNAIVNPPAGVKMFYRPTGTTQTFKHLYTFTEANASTNAATVYELMDGSSYDFRALFNTHQIDTANVLVEDGKHYQVTLPQAACNEIF